MATVVLSAAGSALGSTLAPAGISFLGANISGAALGNAIGNIAGSYIDQSLFGSVATREGPRLSELTLQGSTEGASLPRVYGRVRLSGQIIWATRFKETSVTSSSGGGKGGGGGGNKVETTSFSYSISLAVAICEGPITRVGSIWANGHLLDLSQVSYRVHLGSETQSPDSTLEVVEGAGNVPAYRGVAYIVFDDIPLERFGDRLPQLTFEVFRSLSDVEEDVRGVTLIPGATEFGYDTQAFRRVFADGVSQPENLNNQSGGTDWSVSLDDLQATCPNCASVALVVSWYGDDLRCGSCTLRPKVDRADKRTIPEPWQVAGADRSTALAVSMVEGRSAFGGTPSDRSVKRAIEDLKVRGLAVLYYPFILMDVPAGNGLSDPYGGAEQAVYPWRGRISTSPAPGFVGSPDKSAAITTEVAIFFGTASASDFSVSASGVAYTGPSEWSYRRMVLHNAALCVWAGGVDAFLIGSELRGLTQLRDGPASYPAITQLISLAVEVRSLLGAGTKISYAADWSEYFGHHPQDGSGDVFFHLDPLWSHSEIDFVGIDNYMPLADWRDGLAHLDRQAGVATVYDLDYLKSNIAGGEGYDWFYAGDSDRVDQVRTPITDGAHAKPWVFRPKDLANWWQRSHFDRPGGVEAGSPTGWVAESKPIWFTELGCPAIDKGANQPNVFVDAKSSESALPHFSSGLRDDFGQRRFLQAHLDYWRVGAPGFADANNPVSSVTGLRMVDTDHLFIWTWDARPFPSFPLLTSVWSDGENWKLGHWITGRLGAVPLGPLVAHIASAVDDVSVDVGALTGTVDGFVIDRIMSPRQALEPLMLAYFFDAAETQGTIRFQHMGNAPVATFTSDELAVEEDQASAGFLLSRGQETELPFSVKLTYVDPDAGYRQAAVEARRTVVRSQRVSSAALPIVLRQQEAQRIADIWLQDTWVKRERATLSLPPSAVAFDPGDTVTLDLGDRQAVYRLTGLNDAGLIEADAVQTDASVFGLLATPERAGRADPVATFGAPDVTFLDLPLLSGAEVPHAPHIAATADPWPGGVALYKSATGSGFGLDRVVQNAATMGRTLTSFAEGPTGRWDRASCLRVVLATGELQSVDLLSVLSGANLAAVENEEGDWEVFQFATAELVDVNTYDLSLFLRGQGGTEAAMQVALPADARFVLLNGALEQGGLGEAERGLALQWRYGPLPYGLGHEAYTSETRSFRGIGLRPLSPVHLSARRLAGGDISLRWVRRTRINGDNWTSLEVPLGEETEAYEIDIMEGETAKRTLTAATSSALYDVVDQVADFGSADFSTLTFQVVQLSRAYGRGTAREAQLNV